MAEMSDYQALEQFKLETHGDRWEQEWWPLVKNDFPAYEIFWQRYVVPLTNRICGPQMSEREWTRLRPGVSDRLERMTMFHYSVFYNLARATERVRKTSQLFPEDVFALLDTCGDNLIPFCRTILEILGDFGRSIPRGLPTQRGGEELAPFLEVQEYRDAILHNPVLGHAMDRGASQLPRRAALDSVKLSWRAVARLGPDEFVDSRELYKRLLAEITTFLEAKWRQIIAALDAVRDGEKFKKQWALQGLLPIAGPPKPIASVLNPLSASGTIVVRGTIAASATVGPTWVSIIDGEVVSEEQSKKRK